MLYNLAKTLTYRQQSINRDMIYIILDHIKSWPDTVIDYIKLIACEKDSAYGTTLSAELKNIGTYKGIPFDLHIDLNVLDEYDENKIPNEKEVLGVDEDNPWAFKGFGVSIIFPIIKVPHDSTSNSYDQLLGWHRQKVVKYKNEEFKVCSKVSTADLYEKLEELFHSYTSRKVDVDFLTQKSEAKQAKWIKQTNKLKKEAQRRQKEEEARIEAENKKAKTELKRLRKKKK